MKYLKTFESHSDIAEDIAEDLLPKLEEIKDERGSFTVSDFDEYMEQRGADSHTIDLVMSNLVSMGFDFDTEETEDDEPVEFELKDKFY